MRPVEIVSSEGSAGREAKRKHTRERRAKVLVRKAQSKIATGRAVVLLRKENELEKLEGLAVRA